VLAGGAGTIHCGVKQGSLMKLCVLGSGSKGNAYYVEAGETRILVDAGFSCKELKRRAANFGIDLGSLNGIVISHEHNDHIQGLRVLGRQTTVYATAPTLSRVSSKFKMNGTEPVRSGEAFRIGQLSLMPVPLSHDTPDPVGFVLDDGMKRLGVLTDQGVVTRLIRERLKGLDAIIVEMNHDPEMLINGTYPWELKQRIKGRQGHLSNIEGASLVADVLHPGTRHVLLAHLSEQNNKPGLAMKAMRQVVDGHSAKLYLCAQDRPLDPFEI